MPSHGETGLDSNTMKGRVTAGVTQGQRRGFSPTTQANDSFGVEAGEEGVGLSTADNRRVLSERVPL